MCARNEARPELPRPLVEERVELRKLVRLEGGESGEWGPLVTVKGGWNPPDSAASFPELLLLRTAVFVQPVRRVRDDCLDAAGRALTEPVKRLRVDENGVSVVEGVTTRFVWRLKEGKGRPVVRRSSIEPSSVPHKQVGGIER